MFLTTDMVKPFNLVIHTRGHIFMEEITALQISNEHK